MSHKSINNNYAEIAFNKLMQEAKAQTQAIIIEPNFIVPTYPKAKRIIEGAVRVVDGLIGGIAWGLSIAVIPMMFVGIPAIPFFGTVHLAILAVGLAVTVLGGIIGFARALKQTIKANRNEKKLIQKINEIIKQENSLTKSKTFISQVDILKKLLIIEMILSEQEKKYDKNQLVDEEKKRMIKNAKLLNEAAQALCYIQTAQQDIPINQMLYLFKNRCLSNDHAIQKILALPGVDEITSSDTVSVSEIINKTAEKSFLKKIINYLPIKSTWAFGNGIGTAGALAGAVALGPTLAGTIAIAVSAATAIGSVILGLGTMIVERIIVRSHDKRMAMLEEQNEALSHYRQSKKYYKAAVKVALSKTEKNDSTLQLFKTLGTPVAEVLLPAVDQQAAASSSSKLKQKKSSSKKDESALLCSPFRSGYYSS